MSRSERSFGQFIYDITVQIVPILVSIWGFYHAYQRIQQGDKQETERQKHAKFQLKKHLLQQGRILNHNTDLLQFDSYEERILPDVVFPTTVSVSFDTIGGLVSLKAELHESVILPLVEPHLFASVAENSNLLKPPKGVLFYGPPGTGMLSLHVIFRMLLNASKLCPNTLTVLI